MSEPAGKFTVGFITVAEDPAGYVGGYLVTNRWGRPLEFRLTSPIKANRVQHILYAGTLKPYLYADLIGKTLVEKTSVATRIIVADCEPMLDLRLHISTPVLWLTSPEDALAQSLLRAGAKAERCPAGLLLTHPKFPNDLVATRDALAEADTPPDLSEPFERIREALAEGRKLTAPGRAA